MRWMRPHLWDATGRCERCAIRREWPGGREVCNGLSTNVERYQRDKEVGRYVGRKQVRPRAAGTAGVVTETAKESR